MMVKNCPATLPSVNVFELQDAGYREQVLPADLSVVVEALYQII